MNDSIFPPEKKGTYFKAIKRETITILTSQDEKGSEKCVSPNRQANTLRDFSISNSAVVN